MKKIILSLVIVLVSVISVNAQNDVPNFTNMSEVIHCEGMTINQIYGNIMQNWNNLNGANVKAENSLDYCDKETGTINIKTKVYLGFQKANLLYGWDGYANALITFKIKDGRYKVTLTTNTITFDWTAKSNPEVHTVNINDLYPEFKASPKYIKKASEVLVNKNMGHIIERFFNICKNLHINNEDDF